MSNSGTSIAAAIALILAALATGASGWPSLAAGGPTSELVPRDVRQIYDRGLQFLAASESQDGTWDVGRRVRP